MLLTNVLTTTSVYRVFVLLTIDQDKEVVLFESVVAGTQPRDVTLLDGKIRYVQELVQRPSILWLPTSKVTLLSTRSAASTNATRYVYSCGKLGELGGGCGSLSSMRDECLSCETRRRD